MEYKVLIVDDSRIARMQLKSIMTEENLSISECSSGQEAIEKLQENYYHVVFLDLLMPGIDGFGVLKFMKEHNLSSTKVIVVSADIQTSTKDEILSLGAFGFINKPPDKLTLKNVLSKALKESES